MTVTNLAIEDAAPQALRDYVALTKPRVMSLVVFSGLAGIVLAPVPLHPLLAFIALLCIAGSAGGAAAINMWWERETDALMARTARRPLPQGRLQPHEALEVGGVLIAASTFLMALCLNWQAALLLLLAALYYVFVYTIWLKRRTPQNIVIGGAAGAFPPVIGWVAATGQFDLAPWALFALIFFWTPPHFWALALFRNSDYARAGIPMLPVVKGVAATKRQIMLYSLSLVPLSLLPFVLGMAGTVYAALALALSGLFVAGAAALWRADDIRLAPPLFAYSIFYLFALLGGLMACHMLGL